ncbi:MAG: RHS repeat-associated core domain-containing protein [Acinetobacter sp.]
MSANNAYLPYGYHLPNQWVLGFNGERLDPVTGYYHLGNGYRAFNPSLMRFNSSDSLSPFGQGGLNAYGYCQGDPVNFRDPSGHWLVKALAGMVNRVPAGGQAALVGVADSVPKKFTQLIGFHGTKTSNGPSLKSGLSRGHSQSDRRLQGEGFYITDDMYQAKAYAKVADGPGEVFGAFLQDDLSLVPSVGYAKDKAGRIVLKPTVFPHIQVRNLTPLDVKVVELREAPYALKKKPPPGA